VNIRELSQGLAECLTWWYSVRER